MSNTDPAQVKSPIVTFSSIPLDDEPQITGYDTIPPEARNREITVAGIQFKKGGKIYYFDPGTLTVEAGDEVIIDTARGAEFGYCAEGNHPVPAEKVIQPLRPILRIATDNDRRTRSEYKAKETEAFEVCQEKILEHKLDMKLVSAEYSFDGSRILFYFTADGRVDFRDLVKDLASVFRTRIELRQIGVRDEAKMLGGLGICGRPFCCKQFLEDFQPVSIKMAKTQSLSLNPTKISGTCGRLMCCLKYEQDTYEALIKESPKMDSIVNTYDGKGTVIDVNLLKESVKVRLDSDPSSIKCYQNCDICVLRNGKGKKNDPPIPDDLPPLPKPQAKPQEPETITMFDESILWSVSDESPRAAQSPAHSERPQHPERSERKRRTDREPRETKETKETKEPREPRESKEPGKEAGSRKARSRNRNRSSDKKPKTAPQKAAPEVKAPKEAPAQQGQQPQQGQKEGGRKRSGHRRYYRGKKNRSGGQNPGQQS